METTLNIIKSKKPCEPGWNKLLKSLGKTKADDEPLSLEFILKSNGIEDAVWALRCFDYKDYCLFLADITITKNILSAFDADYDAYVYAYAYAYAAAANADDATAANAARSKKWEEIEQIFIKHFVQVEG
ncbi:MAG: hypothetical protein GY931_06185 [Maribacter sp.]|nr:hypothetical protein [Maribacter sp.]